MFEKIRQFRQKHLLRQYAMLHRSKEVHNIESTKTIGLMFDVTDEATWKVINRFSNEMKKMGKEVLILGRKRTKNIDFVITSTNVIVCELEDFNFWGIPKNYPIGNFFNRHYDILIDTTENPDFYSYYASVRTLADFKIARDKNDNEKYFDFLIKLEDEDFSVLSFLKQTLHYLDLINLEKK